MTMTRRLTQRMRQAVRAHRRERDVGPWWFVFGIDPVAVERAAVHIAQREGAARLHGPASRHTDQLARPASFGREHTWGIEPVHFVLEAGELGVNAGRVRRQWSRVAPVRSGGLVVADAVLSVRTPWLRAHFPGARFVWAETDPDATARRLAARTGQPYDVLTEHITAMLTILGADTGATPMEHLTVPMPSAPPRALTAQPSALPHTPRTPTTR